MSVLLLCTLCAAPFRDQLRHRVPDGVADDAQLGHLLVMAAGQGGGIGEGDVQPPGHTGEDGALAFPGVAGSVMPRNSLGMSFSSPALFTALLQWVDRGDKPSPRSVLALCQGFEATYGKSCRIQPDYQPPPIDARVTPRPR